MSFTLIGALVGAVVGLVSFVVVRKVAAQMDDGGGKTVSSATPAQRVLNIVAWVDLLVFPLVGAYAGSFL